MPDAANELMDDTSNPQLLGLVVNIRLGLDLDRSKARRGGKPFDGGKYVSRTGLCRGTPPRIRSTDAPSDAGVGASSRDRL